MTNTSATFPAKQKCLLWYLVDFRSNKGFSPSLREMREFCNISSTSVVDYNLSQLETRGYLTRHRVARGIVPTLAGVLMVDEIRKEER